MPVASKNAEPWDSTATSPSAQPQPGRPAPEETPHLADPESVSLPALDISATLQPLVLDAKGRLNPPEYGVAGWYEAGPEPGESGSAVIAGHVDSKAGPDVFARLGEAKRGQRIDVELSDGGTVTFRVSEIAQFPTREFPTRRVYGDIGQPVLRLITCGGAYDRVAGRYEDNVVVFAELVR